MMPPHRFVRVSALVVAVAVSAFGIPRQLPAQSSAGAARLSESQRALYARLIAMADVRTLDTAAVDQALVSTSEPLAAFAALSLGQLGRTAAEPRTHRLRALLDDPRSRVAGSAAFALGLLRDTAAVPDLTRALASTDAHRAAEAAWALGQLGDAARQPITAALANPSPARGARIQLLLAASRLRPVPLDTVIPSLHSDDGSVAWAAAYAIARPRVPQGVAALMAAAERPSAGATAPPRGRTPGAGDYYNLGDSAAHRIRAEIARGLTRAAAGDTLEAAAFALLARLARDAHPHVRINALRSIATYHERAPALLVEAAAEDRDANVRLAAVQSLATVREAGTIDWAMLWNADTSFTQRRYVLESAAAQGVRLPQADEWIAAGWRAREAVALASAAARDARSFRSTAHALARDEDARVRAAAYSALAVDTAHFDGAVRERLRAALEDTDEIARAAAISALRRVPHGEDLPLVVAALERSAGDSESDARVAALGYLTAAWRRDSAAFTPELRARLGALPPSPDPVARNAASGLPPLRGWERMTITPRPVAWYAAVVEELIVPSLAGRPPAVVLHTTRGPITLELFAADAPVTVHNFLALARRGYYDGLEFHRVVPNFVVQDGDPRGDGSGGPGYSIRDELNPRRYERGVLGMALSGPDTGGSQYFITHSPQPHLDGGYTVFGRVTSGQSALDAIVQGDRVIRAKAR
jgi:cyclophilin family peptidyl-prolyl cis-trans isomerase/HEAT repeat protein